MNHKLTPVGEYMRLAAVIVLLICLTGAIHACSNRYSSSSKAVAIVEEEQLPDGARQVEAVGGKTVVVRAIDDPENPYRDEYKPWDYWFYEHLLDVVPEEKPWGQLTEEEKAIREAHSMAGMSWLRQEHHLDENGFIVPDSRSIREFEEAIRNDNVGERSRSYNWVMAEGDIDPEMHRAMWLAGHAASAEFYQPVPAWLAENLPHEAMLMPNGDVVTRGLLGDFGKDKYASCCGGDGSVIARYDSGGNLIRALKNSSWFYLYYDADVNPEPEGMPSISRDGYITYRDENTGVLLSVWDWDGTQLPTEEPAWRDPHPFMWINAKRLLDFYNGTAGSQ